MKNLFQTEAVNEIVQRINTLTRNSPRRWGKMEVAQMLAHCTAAMEVATGEKSPPRIFIGRILGPFLKSSFTNDKPLKRNGPTDKSFLVIDQRNFEKEKAKLIDIVNRFSAAGPEKVTKGPHSFFGRLTPMQWATGMYKHLDHHLKQFGV